MKLLLSIAVLAGALAPIVFSANNNGNTATVSAPKDVVDTAISAGSFKTLVAAVQAAGLVDTLKGPGPFTIFAPSDDAFAKLPGGTVESLLKPENKQQLVDLLTYHVVPGKVMSTQAVKADFAGTVQGQALRLQVVELGKDKSALQVDGAKVVKADIDCTNGVIHVIDAVVMPRKNIVETASQAGTFGTLLAAAKAAGLVEALSGKEPLTVFAPTDEAFAKLPAGTVEELLKPENKERLASVLKYHVVAGRKLAKDVVGMKEVATLQGKAARIQVVNGSAKIDNAGIVKTDIIAGNGIIHVIDTVILP
ncbi:MAG: fasciclin domain-containing protein [Planctomycetia bacterium]